MPLRVEQEQELEVEISPTSASARDRHSSPQYSAGNRLTTHIIIAIVEA